MSDILLETHDLTMRFGGVRRSTPSTSASPEANSGASSVPTGPVRVPSLS